MRFNLIIQNNFIMNFKITKLGLRLVLLVAMALSSVGLYAQSDISGVVVDNSGAPVYGAAISVDGTTLGTTTNFDGEFTLKAKSGAAITVFYIGYKDVQTTLKAGMTITLQEDATAIEELVVVGYGSMKKETLTGSIAVVGDEMLKEKGTTTNPLSALQGQVPGVFITRTSAAPGSEDWNINLRGSTSINSSDPLVVIDGFACSSTDEMRLLNPSDIESMSFLKDGAAAIYGSDAAAGVILITTKKGSEGKITVEYNTTATYKYLGNAPSLMNLEQWATTHLEAAENGKETGITTADMWITYYNMMLEYPGGLINTGTTSLPFESWTGLADFPLFDDISWYDSLWGSAWSTDHNVSFSGGNEKTSYHVSLGYLYDGSQLQFGDNKNQRYNIRSNNSYKISDDLTWNSTISYDRENNVTPTDIGSALTTGVPQPGLPLKNINGDPYAWGTNWRSPYGRIEFGGDNSLITDKLTVNESLNYKPLDWLTATATAGYSTKIANRTKVTDAVDYYTFLGDYVTTNPTDENTKYEMTTAVTTNYSGQAYVNAVKTFNDVHELNATLGVQYDMDVYSYYGVEAKEILSGLESLNGSGDVTISESNAWERATLSGFGRLNYAYDGRYLFEINGRYDGSSKFQPENRWDLFGGGSIAWRLSEEDFMKDASWIDNLKLRASYAEMGSQAGIGNYDGIQLFNLVQGSGAYIGEGLLSYIKTNGEFASTTRQWERIKNTNIGLDFGFFDGKLSGSFDVYRKNNDNMLVSIELPSTLGDKAPDANAGKFRAQGWEGMITYRGKIADAVDFSLGGTISYQENELLEYEGTNVLTSGYSNTTVGYGLKSLFGYKCDGKFETNEEADAYIAKYYATSNCQMPVDLRAGDNRFVDVTEDGVINEDDIVYLGSDTAPYSFSFNASLAYKGLDFSAVFQGSMGRKLYNSINNYSVPTRSTFGGSTTASIGKTWTPENQGAYYAPYTLDANVNNYNYQLSSMTAQDASYIRLKNITLGYTVSPEMLSKVALSSIRVYVAGVDLWEHSGLEEGWDPEAKRDASGVSSYPFMRSFTFGLNLTF